MAPAGLCVPADIVLKFAAMTDELSSLDATAQAELVRNRTVSARELVDSAIERIERLNPQLNAVIYKDYDRARHAADSLAGGVGPQDGPLAGVPFLIKDIGATQEGLPYWAGNRVLKELDHRSDGDTLLGARFRDAGLITLGKTNLPELGSTPTTQPQSCGPTNNPWDLDRSPAGSSGGSAAAVASGLVPIAHANDGGGSTRLPAAWCGLVGLKTTRGRVVNAVTTSRLLSELVVSRTVRDTAVVLDAVQGASEADLFRVERPAGPYVDELTRQVSPIRIAVVTDGGVYPVDPTCVEAVRATAAVLEADGHHVEEISGEVLFGPPSAVNGRLWMAGLARRVQQLGEMAGRELTAGDVEPYNWTAAERGKAMTAIEWVAAEEEQQAWVGQAVAAMAPYDLLMTPTAGSPPLTTAELEPPDEKPWQAGRTHGMIGQFTLPFNATGHPAISLPVWETASGLPIGVQLVGGMGREDLVLRLAAFLEDAMPWRDRTPGVFAGP